MSILSDIEPAVNPATPEKLPFFRWSYDDELEIICSECQGIGQYRYHHDPDGTSHSWDHRERTETNYHDGWWWKTCWVCHGERYISAKDSGDHDVMLWNEMVERDDPTKPLFVHVSSD